MIVDKMWKFTNVVGVILAPRSPHSQGQATFPDKPLVFKGSSPPTVMCMSRCALFSCLCNGFKLMILVKSAKVCLTSHEHKWKV
jgi:hypothetical protein